MTVQSPPIALSIAGFDPSGGAGITADLKTFSSYGLYGMACISALTIQSTQGVRAVRVESGGSVRETLDCLSNDVSFAGVKIGMLGNSHVAREVHAFLLRRPAALDRSRIVLDPIVCSSSGAALIDPDGVRVIQEQLLTQVGWITPNIAELAVLTGRELVPGSVTIREQMATAARHLKHLAAKHGNDELNIVVTGGHLDRPDDLLLEGSGEETWLSGQWVETQSTHGTGCAFSSALLCEVIGANPPRLAARRAKTYVAGALSTAYPIGQGRGPMNHLFRLRRFDD